MIYLQSSAGAHRRNVRWLEFLSQFDFGIAHIKGKENVVADTLSRVPGSELLTATELCNMCYTLGIAHVEDLPLDLCADTASAPVASVNSAQPLFLNGVISINERDSFRAKLLSE